MDIVRRAYIQTMQKNQDIGVPIEAFHQEMKELMVRWIQARVYSKRDWPKEFGEYPGDFTKPPAENSAGVNTETR